MGVRIDKKPLKERLSIVLRGSFNPAIFHPAWFSKNELISDQEAEEAVLEISHKEICIFSLDWCKLEIVKDRFSITTSQEHSYEYIKDLIIGSFNILNHTPIEMLGINIDREYKVDNLSAWHDIGNALAPKEHWEGILKNPGMKNLSIEGVRDDEFEGKITFSVSPTPNSECHINISVNDHYILKGSEGSEGLDCSAILSNWKSSFSITLKRIDGFVSNLSGIGA